MIHKPCLHSWSTAMLLITFPFCEHERLTMEKQSPEGHRMLFLNAYHDAGPYPHQVIPNEISPLPW